jgi:hypothetical protein
MQQNIYIDTNKQTNKQFKQFFGYTSFQIKWQKELLAEKR